MTVRIMLSIIWQNWELTIWVRWSLMDGLKYVRQVSSK
jgi:hypothetical protein